MSSSILMVGPSKTGTTGLYDMLKRSVLERGRNYAFLFEPTRPEPFVALGRYPRTVRSWPRSWATASTRPRRDDGALIVGWMPLDTVTGRRPGGCSTRRSRIQR